MKRIITLIMISIMMFGTVSVVSHADVAQAIHIYDNGERIEFPESMGNPFISSDSRTMIPLRAVSEKLGFEISWDGDSYSAIIKGDANTIILPVNESFGFVNGEKVQFDTTTIIKSGRTYVPLRFVGETLGYEIKWRFGSDAKANGKMANIIDLIKKSSSVGESASEVDVMELDLSKDKELLTNLEKYGNINEQDSKVIVNRSYIEYYPKGSDSMNNPEVSISMTSNGYVQIEYDAYNDNVKAFVADVLEEIFPESANVSDLYIKMFQDIQGTLMSDEFGSFYLTSKLDQDTFKINDFTVKYREMTYFTVDIRY